MREKIKAILVLVGLLAIASFAQGNEKKAEDFAFHTFNFTLPIEHEVWDTKKNDFDSFYSYFGYEFSWKLRSVNQSGFSSLAGFSAGYIKETGNLSGFDYKASFGRGFTFVGDNVVLGVHGIVGIDIKYLLYNEPKYHIESWFHFASLFSGAEVFACFRITKNVGITAGVDWTVNYLGIGKYRAVYHLDDDRDEVYIYYHYSWLEGFSIMPQIGFSYFF